MPATSLILPDYASKAASEGTLRLVVVPLKEQPPASVQSVDLVNNVWLGTIRRDPELAADGSVLLRETTGAHGPRSAYECPFRVGSELRIREAWRPVGCYPDNGQVHLEWMAGGRGHTDNVPGWSRYFQCDADGPWRSAATMPPWAVRSRVRVENVEVRRLHQFSMEEARLAGLPGPLHQVISTWDAAHKLNCKWALNPFCWFVRVSDAKDGA